MTPQCDLCGCDAVVSAAGWGCACCGKYVAGDLSPAEWLATLSEAQGELLYNVGYKEIGGAWGIMRTSALFGCNPCVEGCADHARYEREGVEGFRAREGGQPVRMRKRLEPNVSH